MVIGLGIGEHFAASDIFALLPVTRRFISLQENDLARISRDHCQIYDASGAEVTRAINESEQAGDLIGKGGYKHYMQKEIFEQPTAIADTLEGRLAHGELHLASFRPELLAALKRTRQLHIVACAPATTRGSS